MPAATAESLNGELGGSSISPTLALLTTRERQVAVAVACGMSNTQAAAALSMAAKTVESHLGRVYAKLGIVSGFQLAASIGASVAESRHCQWVSLSPREQQVAAAIASGLSNRQAGHLLFVSPKTIEYHLGCVYRKLQIGSRRQLPAIAGQLTVAFD